MKLIKIDLDLPPFCEDVEFPSLCEGLYSKNMYILFLSLLHLEIREFFFLIKKNSEKLLQHTNCQSEKDYFFLKQFEDLPGIAMKHLQLVAFLTCTESLNSSRDNRCGCTVELITMLEHSTACLTHTCLQYCVCPDVQ